MATTDLKTIMREHQLMLDVCNDTDLSGDAKLFVLLAISLWSAPPPDDPSIKRIGKPRRTLRELAERSGHHSGMWWVRKVIRDDIPRYQHPLPEHRVCTAPMVRRDGECGKNAISSGVLYDPITGEGTWYGFCSRHRNHHDDWTIRQQNKEWDLNGRPSPPPNKGGILCRYLKNDWDALYKWAAPYATPLEGAKPATPPKVELRLIVGGDQ